MALPKLLLAPDADGYSSSDGIEVVVTALDGGFARYRRDKLGASGSIGLTWTLNPSQYQYWRAFYATAIRKGALPFLCDIVSEDGLGPVATRCQFIPGSVGLSSQTGFTYVVKGQVEFRPIPHVDDVDIAVMAWFEATGGFPDTVYNQLDRIVTVILPGALGA